MTNTGGPTAHFLFAMRARPLHPIGSSGPRDHQGLRAGEMQPPTPPRGSLLAPPPNSGHTPFLTKSPQWTKSPSTPAPPEPARTSKPCPPRLTCSGLKAWPVPPPPLLRLPTSDDLHFRQAGAASAHSPYSLNSCQIGKPPGRHLVLFQGRRGGEGFLVLQPSLPSKELSAPTTHLSLPPPHISA